MQETIREELNGSKSRYEKGIELFKQGKVSIKGDGLFKVSGYYEVDTGKMTCTCPDYKTRKESCKHIFASLLFTKNGNGNVAKFEVSPKDASTKPVEGHSKDFSRQSTITRLAVLNTATEILKTQGKPVKLADVISLASQLETWALRK